MVKYITIYIKNDQISLIPGDALRHNETGRIFIVHHVIHVRNNTTKVYLTYIGDDAKGMFGAFSSYSHFDSCFNYVEHI